MRAGVVEPAASAARGGLRPAGSPGAVDEACLKGGCAAARGMVCVFSLF